MIKLIPMQCIQTESGWDSIRSDIDKTEVLQDVGMEDVMMQAHYVLQSLDLSYHGVSVSGEHFSFTIDRVGLISGYVDVIEHADE